MGLDKKLVLNDCEWNLMGFYKNQWRLYESMELGHEILPAIGQMKATIPGSVQTDLLANGWLRDPNIGLVSLQGEWVTNREWVYRTSFRVEEGWLEDRCELVFEGLDYAGQIQLNGIKLIEFEGMFTPVKLDVTGGIRADEENHLTVIFYTVPEVDGQMGYSNQIQKLKSRFNYAWDWCPRIVPVGIWKDVYLHTYRQQVKINDFYPDATVEGDWITGQLRLRTEVTVEQRGSYTISYRVENSHGERMATATYTKELTCGDLILEHELRVADVELWWPNGYGNQPLYTVTIEISDASDKIVSRDANSVGFRKLEFAHNPESPENALPYTLLINGKRIFMKGVNWVPIRPFYGDIKKDEYLNYLGRFKEMNVNLVRVWGGAIIEKQEFYAYCDANGLMVWQELLQSSSGINNTPPDDPQFIDELERVAIHAVKEKRSHPSLVIWCGGNELMWEGFKPVDERHSNIARLKRVVEELNPGNRFLPTSASGPSFTANVNHMGKGMHHDVHGPWNYLEKDHYEFFNKDDSLLLSEMGTPGITRPSNIEKYADECSVWPPTKDNPYWVHRGAWWIQWDQLNRLFGEWNKESNELHMYSRASRYVQMESLRYAVEATRRREPQASGFIVWMGNEPFANNSNTSVIEYDGMVKPAYYALRDAFSALHVSAKYAKVGYAAGELFESELFLHDEQDASGHRLEVRAEILGTDGTVYSSNCYFSTAKPFSQSLGKIAWTVAEVPHSLFFMRLQVLNEDRQLVCANTYMYSTQAECYYQPLRKLPTATLKLNLVGEGQLDVCNVSDRVAVGVLIQEKEARQFTSFDHNYLYVFPRESVRVKCSMRNLDDLELLVIDGFNIDIG